MKTKLQGAFEIHPERIEDERGFFARVFCSNEFGQRGLNPDFVQCNISYNKRKGTLRGMHYQIKPKEEAKLVRCTMGSIFDVIMDLRSNSLTYGQWFSIELSAENRKMLYIPEGFAHGFITLKDDTEVFYHMNESYHHECAKGIRWDDPVFAIRWPFDPEIISKKDLNYPDYIL